MEILSKSLTKIKNFTSEKKETKENKNSSVLSNLLQNISEQSIPVIATSMQKQEQFLPHLINTLKHTEKSNFIDHALALMCACIAERDYFTSFDYEQIVSEYKNIFGEESFNAYFQSKLNIALLQDYTTDEKRLKVIEEFKVFLENSVNSSDFSSSSLDTLYSILARLSLEEERKKYSITSVFFEEIELIFMEYKIQRKKETIFYTNSQDISQLPSEYSSVFENLSLQNINKNASKIFEKTQSSKILSSLNPFSRKESENNLKAQEEERENKLHSLENFSLAFRNSELLDKIHDFRSLLIPQDFKLVVLGGGKRGKSSLVNAILGKNFLPTRSVLPETGTLIELYSSHEVKYGIEWINKVEFEELEKNLQQEKNNLLLEENYKNLRDILNNDNLLERLQSLQINQYDELKKYISANGLYTSFVKKVSIGINTQNLPKNILLVDTPAINSTNPFYTYLTKKECLKADCLILVLDARQPDNYTELQFIKELTKNGRAVKIVGVLTHLHDNKEENNVAKQRALQTLNETIREVQDIELLGIFSFNPKSIVDIYEKNTSLISSLLAQKFDTEYLHFINTLTKTVEEATESSLLAKRLDSTYNTLLNDATTYKQEEIEKYTKNLPNQQHVEILTAHSKHLTEATEKYAKHAYSLIQSAIHDIEEWKRQGEISISLLTQRIKTNISNEIHKHILAIEKEFKIENTLKEEHWKNFDEEKIPQIIKNLINDFNNEQRESLKSWEEKIKIFNEEAQGLSLECLSEIQISSDKLNNLCSTQSKFDHRLMQGISFMSTLPAFMTGAAATSIFTGSLVLNVLFLEPTTLTIALAVGASGYIFNRLASHAKIKEKFIKEKEEKANKFIIELEEKLKEKLDEIQIEIISIYSQAIQKSLAPALEIMAGEAINIHSYIEVINKQNKEIENYAPYKRIS